VLTRFLERQPAGVALSAINGEACRRCCAELGSQLRPIREFIELAVPHGQASVIARLHEVGQVIERHYEGKPGTVKCASRPIHEEFAPFIVREVAGSVAKDGAGFGQP